MRAVVVAFAAMAGLPRIARADPAENRAVPAAAPLAPCPEARPSAEASAPRDPLEGRRRAAMHKDVVPVDSGFSLALRAGWGMPQGRIRGGLDLSAQAVAIVPIWLDLGYRLNEAWLVGVYSQYAFGLVNGCPSEQSCHGSDVRFGLQAQWHFGSRRAIDHWVGLGAGFEIYEEKLGARTRRYTGFELANAQFGEDFSLGRRFGLGPFVSASLAEFTALREEETSRLVNDSVLDRKRLHGWIVLGLRLSFGA